jgi:DNA-binding NarL/FixJ family response regulator
MSINVSSVLLVEDDLDIRTRLSLLLQKDPSLNLVACASDVDEGISALREHLPDILLTDLGLPSGCGTNIIRDIDNIGATTQAIVVSGFQDELRVFAALKAGAKGYILKQDPSQDILQAIKMMLKGGAPMSPAIARLVLSYFHPPRELQTTSVSLTERQTSILNYISQGFSSKEIAEKLKISYYTVTTHIKNIYNQLQVNSRTEAIHEAKKSGLLP